MTGQLKNVMVCQVCGRSSPLGEKHWLDEPHRTIKGVRVVRCPQHWSEWALRNCVAGRTNEMRKRARIAKQQPVPSTPVHLTPIPALNFDGQYRLIKEEEQ